MRFLENLFSYRTIFPLKYVIRHGVLYDTVLFKLANRLRQQVIRDMHITVHRGFDACMSKQQLLHFRRHPGFDCPGSISMPQNLLIPASSHSLYKCIS